MILADLVYGNDVAMLQCGQCLHFVKKMLFVIISLLAEGRLRPDLLGLWCGGANNLMATFLPERLTSSPR